MTNEQIIAALGVSLTQMVEALRAADALNALKLGGKTLEEIKTEITGDVDLSNVVLKTDDLGQYEVEVILPGLPDPQRLNLAGLLATQASQGKVTQDALQNFIANPATEEDAQAGIDNTKYLTALGLKAVIDALTLKVFGEMPVGTDIRPFGSRPTSSTTELYDLQANPDGLTYSYDINSVGVCTYDLTTNPGNPVRGLVWNLTGLPEGVNIRLDIDSVISGGPNSNYVGFTATPAATNPGADTAVTGGETSYNFVYDSATPFLMVRSDYPNDNLTHLTCTLFAEINGEQVTVFNNFSGNADSILKLRQDLANLQTEVDGKLNADGQAADSAKLEGKTLAEVLASVPPATDLLDFTQAPYNVFVNNMGYSDYAAIGPGVYTGVVPNNDNVNPHLNLESGMETAVMTVWIAPANSQRPAGSLEVARKVEILGNASDDGVVHATMYHYASINADGSAVSDIGWVTVASQAFVTTAVNALKTALLGGGDSAETLKKLRDDLSAFIAKKATGAEAIAGTDDEKYITALALKAKVDDAINALVNGAPEAYDTLKELADALADQDDALAALVTQMGTKLGKTETAASSKRLTPLGVSHADAVTLVNGTPTQIVSLLILDVGLASVKVAATDTAGYLTVPNITDFVPDWAVNTNDNGILYVWTRSKSSGGGAGNSTIVFRELKIAGLTLIQTGDAASDTWGAWNRCANLDDVVAGAYSANGVAVAAEQQPMFGGTSTTISTALGALLQSTGGTAYGEVITTIGISNVDSTDGWGSVAIPELATILGDNSQVLPIRTRQSLLNGISDPYIEQEIVYKDLMWRRDGFLNSGMNAWLKIGGGVAEDANKLGGHDASYFAVKDDVNAAFQGLVDTMDTLTDKVNGIDRLTMTLTPGAFGGGVEFGYEEGDRGTLVPATFKDSDNISDLSWNTSTDKISLDVPGDYTTSTLIDISIAGVKSTAVAAPTFGGGFTSWVFDVASADSIPTTGDLKVILRGTILPKA